MKASQYAGFTLIELLVVVAVLGVLLGVLVPRFVNARSLAQNSAANTYAYRVALWVASAEIGNPTDARGSFAGSCTDPALQAQGAVSTHPGSVSDCLVTYQDNMYTITVTSIVGRGGPSNNGVFTTTY